MSDTPQSPADRHGDATPDPAATPDPTMSDATAAPDPMADPTGTPTPPSGERLPPVEQFPGGQPSPGQAYPGRQQGESYPGQPHGEQSYPGQGYPGGPTSGQPYPGQAHPGEAYPGQPQPGQSYPGQPYPDQSYPGQPYPGQPGPYPGQPGQPHLGKQPSYPGGPAPFAIKPGVVPLRPLSVTEILDGAVSTMRRHLKLLLGVSFLVVTVTQVVSLLATLLVFDDIEAATADPNNPPEDVGGLLAMIFGVVGLSLILALLAQVFLSGFVTVVVSKAVLGWPVSMRTAWDELKQRLLPLLGLTLLVTLIVVVGFVLCIVPGVWLWVLLGLAVPAMMFERQPVTAALKRSAALVRGSWWRVFGILLLAALIAFLISLVLQIPFSLVGALASGGDTTGLDPLAVTFDSIGAIVSSALVYPISAAVTALVYVDQRMRREGLDIELARTVGAPPPSQSW